MAHLTTTTAILSSLLRVAVYLFLRVVPSRLLRTAIPSIYAAYATTLLFSDPTASSSTERQPTENGTEHLKTETKQDERDPAQIAATTTGNVLYPGPVASLVFSLPSPSRTLRIVNFVINTALLLASIEFVVTPWLDNAAAVTFTRVGALYPDAAKVVVRYPLQNATEHHLRVLYRQVGQIDTGETLNWKEGPSVNLTSDTDWISTVRLGGLWPSTSYEYILEDIETKSPLPYPSTPLRFRTFPDPRLPTGSHFRFIVSSCATPNFPYAPLQGRRIKGFDLLAEYLWPTKNTTNLSQSLRTEVDTSADGHSTTSGMEAGEPSPLPTSESLPSTSPVEPVPAEFMLFLGDFIYADVPVYFGDDQGAYRRLYRRNYLSPSFKKIYERLPMFHAYDDHEIRDNFVGQGNDSTPPFPNAADAFRRYNADANYDSHDDSSHYYDFRYADVAFFVLDTRRYRSDAKTVDIASRTMLGEKQLAALYDWLGKVNNTATFKFIVSSVPFTSLWQHDAVFDSWAGYAYEKAALVSTLHSVSNVIILSGDRHEFAAIEFTGEGSGHKFLEISTSPLSMFYVPFVRTLQSASQHMVRRSPEDATADAAPAAEEAEESSVLEIPQEQVLKAIATGNYKWSSIEIDTRDAEHPTAYLEVVIDGNKAYGLTIAGQPVPLQAPTTALGTILPEGFKGILDRIGLMPTRWF